MSHTNDRNRNRIIAALMLLEAITLATMSTLHLTGVVNGGKTPYDPTDAGIAEAIICIVLAGGALALIRAPQRGRTPALGALGFAIVGFVLGLTFTIRGGTTADVVYHATMLPVLIATAILLARSPRHATTHRPPAPPSTPALSRGASPSPTTRSSSPGSRAAESRRPGGSSTSSRR
jgi:peptidoglycan/LPS O-acetylase OafA/YrhL